MERWARAKGCGRWSRRRGVVGGAAAVCVLGGWSALNKGPQPGFHNSISGGQAETSAVQTGKLRWRLQFPIFEKGGACHPLLRFIHLPQEGTVAQEPPCLLSSSSGTHKEGRAGSPGHTDPPPPLPH